MKYLTTPFGEFYIGQAVTYSCYPHVENGNGMVSHEGILTVGQTFMDVCWDLETKALDMHDVCYWENVFDLEAKKPEELEPVL